MALYHKIPNTFLKVPDIANIGKKPTDPYNFGTIGMLHSSKFKSILKCVITEKTQFTDELKEVLDGHRLKGILPYLEIDELADWCRHIVYANKGNLGWEFVDELNYTLKNKYTPRWELPNLRFDSGFRAIFLSRETWEPSDNVRSLLKDFFEEYEKFEEKSLDIKSSLKLDTQKIWNFRDLFIILNELSYLINNYKGVIEVDKYNTLQNQLKSIFIDNYRNKLYSEEQRVSLLFLYINGALHSFYNEFEEFRILIDNSYTLIKNLDEDVHKSYRWIFGYSYANLSKHLFNATSDLIVRRDLVVELIQEYYKPDEIDLGFWSKHLYQSKPHPLLFTIILNGYLGMSQMMVKHAKELPNSKTQRRLRDYHKDLIHFMYDLICGYLDIYYGIDISQDMMLVIQELNNKIQSIPIRRTMQQVMVYVLKWRLLFAESAEEQDYARLKSWAENYKDEIFANGHVIDIKIRRNEYPFEQILEKILKEVRNSDSIILSETFEEEVISVTGDLFGKAQQSFMNKNEVNIDAYERVMFFTFNWMYQFQHHIELKFEGLLMLSPLISICYIQIARGYFERGNLEAAFLTYFNNHYLIEYVNLEVANHLKDDEKTQSKLTNKFVSLINEWEIDYVIQEDYVKKLTTNIDVQIKKRVAKRADKTFSMSGMLDDEIVISYLDMVADLEQFLGKIPDKIDHNFSHLILNSKVYSPPNKQSIYRHEHMGMISGEFPFPIIRQINAYSVAIKLYPIDVKLPGSVNFKLLLSENDLKEKLDTK